MAVHVLVFVMSNANGVEMCTVASEESGELTKEVTVIRKEC